MYRNFSNKRKYQDATSIGAESTVASAGQTARASGEMYQNFSGYVGDLARNAVQTAKGLTSTNDGIYTEYLPEVTIYGDKETSNPSELDDKSSGTDASVMDSEIDTPSNLNEKQQEKLDKLREKLSNVEAGKGKGIQDLLDLGTIGGIAQMLTDLPERSLYMAGLQSTEGARGKGRALFNVLQAGISAAGSGLMGYAGGKAGEGAPSTTQVTEESSTESPDDMVFVQGADGKYRQIRRGDIVTAEETTKETTEEATKETTEEKDVTQPFAMGGRVPLVKNQDNNLANPLDLTGSDNQLLTGVQPVTGIQSNLPQAVTLPSPSLASANTIANPITVNENLLQPVSVNPAASFDVFQPVPSTVSLPASMQQIGPQAVSTPDMKPMVDFTTDTDGDGIPDYLDQSDDSITTEPVTEEEEEKTRATKLAELLALGQQASTFGDITSTAGLTGYLGSQIDENPLLGTLGTVAGTGSTLFKGARSFLGGQSYGQAMAGDDARARQRRRQMLITSPTMGEEIAQLQSYLATDRGDARAQDGKTVEGPKVPKNQDYDYRTEYPRGYTVGDFLSGEIPETNVLGDDFSAKNAARRLFYDYLAGEGSQTDKIVQGGRIFFSPVTDFLVPLAVDAMYPFMSDEYKEKEDRRRDIQRVATEDLDDYKDYLKQQGKYKTPGEAIKDFFGFEDGGKKNKYAGGGINIPLDSRGLFRHPNRVVDVPLSKGKTITMKDQKGKPKLPKAILAIPDGDPPTVIFRGQDKQFPNSDVVREIPLNQALYG